MEIGFECVAAKPKGLRADTDAPHVVPMRPRQLVQKNPTTDQKKVRRQMARQQRTAAVNENGLDLELAHHVRKDHGMFVRYQDAASVQDLHDRAHSVGGVYHDHPEDQQKTAVVIYTCLNCEQRVRPTGYDDVPWVHHGSGNAFCDVTHPEDAVRNSVFNPTGMRPEADPVRRNAVRHLATEIPASADKLRPGDSIRGPNNSTVTVRQVRLHKIDSTKVLVDTDAGTLVVPRTQNFTIVPTNMRQRETPDQGPVAASPVNGVPMGGRGNGDTGTGAGTGRCPVCGSAMQLRRANGNALYICPRDGYSTQANGLGGTSDPDLLNQRRSTLQTTAEMRGSECRGCGGKLVTDAVDHVEGTVHAHCEDCGMEHQLQNVQHATGAKKEWVVVQDFDPYITTTANTKSAIARRAQAVLNMEEGSL